MQTTKILPILLIAGGLPLAGCGKPPSRTDSQRSVAAPVMTARYDTVPATVEAPGSVQPRDRIKLSAQINGFVRSVAVEAGEMVRPGQLVVTLDAREAESQKAMAQAAVEEAAAALGEARKGGDMAVSMRSAAKAQDDLAAATLNRYQKLFEAKSVSPQELDEVRAKRQAAAADLAAKETMVAAAQDRLKQVEARIAQAKAQSSRADVVVGWTSLTAPSAGRVVERMVDPGTAIFPGNPLLVIESAGNPQVLAEISTLHLSQLRLGMEVGLRCGASEVPIMGRIAEIVPQSDPSTHTVRFKVDLPAGVAPPSGSFARVLIPVGSRQALLVGTRSIRETGQLTGLFVVDGASKARYRLIKTAPYEKDRVEVLSGIEPGERIIAALTDEIMDGITVEARQ